MQQQLNFNHQRQDNEEKRGQTNRRQFMIATAAVGLGLSTLGTALSGCAAPRQQSEQQLDATPANNLLHIPELIDSQAVNHDVQISIQEGAHEFFPGVKSVTKGFNGDYLGPTVRLYRGQDTRIRFTNALNEATTVHGHGLHIAGELDGGPQSIIDPGATWDIVLPIRQQAGTSWYHPHLMHKTAEHVHAGLAGLYLIEDENSLSLPLPKTYGVDDIPVVVQDRDFTAGKMNTYSVTEGDLMDGKREDTLVINGTIDPYVEVSQGWVRLRLLNGSNARFYRFYLPGNETFYKIATEGGFLEDPVEMTDITMAPGERNEIMIDMSNGVTRSLLAQLLPTDDDYGASYGPRRRVLELRVDSTRTGEGQLPDKLNTINPLVRADAVVTRTFELQMGDGDEGEGERGMGDGGMGEMFSINGQPMRMDVINERVKKGDVEIWRITGEDMLHPFHMHGTSFLILSQDGNAPVPADQGWKDVVVVGDGWTDVIMRFDYEATEEYPYMYHCHIFEHEDHGMMGQFTVT
ncbi:MAG: multicopper oxidase domain-containing protein [Chloroflexota bacterium]